MVDITHRVGIKAPAEKVYKALSSIDGLAHWWSEEVTGDGKVGGKIQFIFRALTGELKGTIEMEVQALDPSLEVRWRCTGEMEEWIGTDITFELSEQDNLTIVQFAHRNWRELTEFTSHCSMKWAVFLLSLREYVESGKGWPSPHDLKIDNWN